MGEMGVQLTRTRNGRKRAKEKRVMDNLLGSPTLAERIALLQRSARNHKGGPNISGTPLILPEVSSSSSTSNDEASEAYSEGPHVLAKGWNASTTTSSDVEGVDWPGSDSWAQWASVEDPERAASDVYPEVVGREVIKDTGIQTKKSHSFDAANDDAENDFSAASVNRRLDQILDKLSRLSLPENATDEERQDVDLIRNMASLSFEKVVAAGGTGRVAEVDDHSIDWVVREVIARGPNLDPRRKIFASTNSDRPVLNIGSPGLLLRDPRDTADWGFTQNRESATSDAGNARSTGPADRFIPHVEAAGQADANDPTEGEITLKLLNTAGPRDVEGLPPIPRKWLDPSYPYYGLEGTGRLGIAERVDVFQSQRVNQQRSRLDDTLSISSVVDTDEGVSGTPRTANGAAANRNSFWTDPTNASGHNLTVEKSASHTSSSPVRTLGLHRLANPAESTKYGRQTSASDDVPATLLVEGYQVPPHKEEEWNSRKQLFEPFAFEQSEGTRPTSSIELDACASSLTGISQEFHFGWDGTPLAQRRYSMESTASLSDETFQRSGFGNGGAVVNQAVESGPAKPMRYSTSSVDFMFLKPERGQSSSPDNENLLARASSFQRGGRSKTSIAGFTACDSSASELSFPMNDSFFGDKKDSRCPHVPVVLQSSIESLDFDTASQRHHIKALPPPSIVCESNVYQHRPSQFDQRQQQHAICREGESFHSLDGLSPRADDAPSQQQNCISYGLDQIPRPTLPLAHSANSDVRRPSSTRIRFPGGEEGRFLRQEMQQLPSSFPSQTPCGLESQGFVDPRIGLKAHILHASDSPMGSGHWQGSGTCIDSGMVNSSKVLGTLRPPSLVDESQFVVDPRIGLNASFLRTPDSPMRSGLWQRGEAVIGVVKASELRSTPRPPSLVDASASTSTRSRTRVTSASDHALEKRANSRTGCEQSMGWEPFERAERKHLIPVQHFSNVERFPGRYGEHVQIPESLDNMSSQRETHSSDRISAGRMTRPGQRNELCRFVLRWVQVSVVLSILEGYSRVFGFRT
jgi:hypothetical protein